MTKYKNTKDKKYSNPFYSFRSSRILRTVRRGKVATMLKCNTSDNKVAEIFSLAQPDAIWLCMEHSSLNFVQAENQVNAAKIYDVDSILRVSRGGYSDYIRGLEIDCAGLMIPQIKNLDDAKNVRDITKFPPLGKRGVDGGNNDGKYAKLAMNEYLELANTERLIIYQIENPSTLPDLEAIAEMEGVDALFFGPGDYSLALGVPGQINHPEIQRVRKLVADVARKNNKIAGTPSSTSVAKDYINMGYNLLNLGADVLALTNYAENLLETFHKINT